MIIPYWGNDENNNGGDDDDLMKGKFLLIVKTGVITFQAVSNEEYDSHVSPDVASGGGPRQKCQIVYIHHLCPATCRTGATGNLRSATVLAVTVNL
jgi:hypothetical protein